MSHNDASSRGAGVVLARIDDTIIILHRDAAITLDRYDPGQILIQARSTVVGAQEIGPPPEFLRLALEDFLEAWAAGWPWGAECAVPDCVRIPPMDSMQVAAAVLAAALSVVQAAYDAGCLPCAAEVTES